MKLKHLFFYTRKQWEHHLYLTAKGCMRSKRYKNEITVRYGIKLQPKRRHFRSIAKNRAYQFGEAYKILKNRSYMHKTRHRLYNRIEAVWNYSMHDWTRRKAKK